MPRVKVYVYKRGESPSYYMKWVDPKTRALVRRSADTTVKREAERAAAKIEQRFADGTYSEPQYTTWKEFRHRYESEYMEGLAEGTQKKILSVFNSIEKLLKPRMLSEIDSGGISKYVKKMRAKGLSESTLKSHLAHLKAALNWAKVIGKMLDEVPAFPKIVRAKKTNKRIPMKGRPITAEEFERMLVAVPLVMNEKVSGEWIRLLRGLWLSGLRLDEALNLNWTGTDCFRVDLTGKYPMFIVVAETEKGHQDRILPMATEFADFLRETPEKLRTGRVFKPRMTRQHDCTLDRVRRDTASKLITSFGEKAVVRVTSSKWASAHDLRRAFGERWAGRVMPHILQQMMRHESIETTMRYYVGKNAESVAAMINEASFGPNLGPNDPDETSEEKKENPQPSTNQRVAD